MYFRNTKMSEKLGADNTVLLSLSNSKISAFVSLQFHKPDLSVMLSLETETWWTAKDVPCVMKIK